MIEETQSASTALPRSSASPLIQFTGIGKTFGKVTALSGVDFDFGTGECIGIAGHNGAGKSTLMAILAGVFPPSGGQIEVQGQARPHYDANTARQTGVRCVFQELSLCANLSVAENLCVVHPRLRGIGWRKQARALIRAKLDEIFPGSGLTGDELVADLTLTQRQMVEIARGFTETDVPVRLMILDEPTSSLDAHTADQLLRYVRAASAHGITCLIVTHMLGEIEQVADRVMVMRDGCLVRVLPRAGLTRDAIIVAMGQHIDVPHAPQEKRARINEDNVKAYQWALGTQKRVKIDARQGEVIGLGGLAGQGQTEALLEIYTAAQRASGTRVAFVAGDRARDGVFPVWSIAQNLDLRWLENSSARDRLKQQAADESRRSGTGFLIDFAAARALVDKWRAKIDIRGASMHAGILSLSGGNQQKVLFARALASNADLILMDDPTRGVDVGTKRDIYQLVREEAAKGRTFIWYTTENDELAYCDRTFVFCSGLVTKMLYSDECTEEALLAASFAEHAA